MRERLPGTDWLRGCAVRVMARAESSSRLRARRMSSFRLVGRGFRVRRPVEVDGIAKQQQMPVGVADFDTQPVARAVRGPGGVECLIRIGERLRRKPRSFGGIEEVVNRGSGTVGYVDVESYGGVVGSSEHAAHFGRVAACRCIKIELSVARAGCVEEDAPGANAVEQRGDGQLARIDHRSWIADGGSVLGRPFGAVVVAAADGSKAIAALQLLSPETGGGHAAAIDDFDGGDEAHVGGRRWIPAAAHADFAGRRLRMVDGDNGAEGTGGAKHRVDVGDFGRADAVIDVARRTEFVGMAVKGGELAAWNEEQLVEVRLQLAFVVILRGCVVVGDGDEVETALGCILQSEKEWTWNGLAGLAGTATVAVCGVHVEVAAIPAGLCVERFRNEGRIVECGVEPHLSAILRGDAGADVRHGDEKFPAAGRNGSGEVGGGGVGIAQREVVLVAAAVAAKAKRIGDAEIEDGALIVAEVLKGDGDAMGAGRDREWNREIGLVLGWTDGALENQVGRGHGLGGGTTAAGYQQQQTQQQTHRDPEKPEAWPRWRVA